MTVGKSSQDGYIHTCGHYDRITAGIVSKMCGLFVKIEKQKKIFLYLIYLINS